MNSDFSWKKEYAIGIDEIDIQHERLLSVIKTIFELSEKTTDDNRINNLLEELVRGLQFHFDSEELMMKTYNYPYISEQKMQHELMRRNTFRLIEEVKQNRTILIQLLFNLEKWFIEHDNDFDKEFGKYVLRIRNSL